MASFVSSSVTTEQFNTFHAIDRELYTKLVFNLSRDATESMQVMGLWLWLEQVNHDHRLVKRMVSLPETLINALADETVMCLNCIESDKVPLSSDTNDISLIQSLTKTEISLGFFHENRLGVIRGVTKIVNDVCTRAFHDILQKAWNNKPILMLGPTMSSTMSGGIIAIGEPSNIENVGDHRQFMMHPIINPVLTVPFYNPSDGTVHVPQYLPNLGKMDRIGFSPHVVVMEGPVNYASKVLPPFEPYDVTAQRQVLNSEITKLSSHINLSSNEEEKEVPPDDRTIFLTFSKGYPISENDVREFITKKYGDCIEAIRMQEVLPDEQVLYARLVVRSEPTMEVVLGGHGKAKFTINGKHVWGRKYVRKHPKSPSQPASPTSRPTSPATHNLN